MVCPGIIVGSNPASVIIQNKVALIFIVRKWVAPLALD